MGAKIGMFFGAVLVTVVGTLAAQYLINNVTPIRRTVGGL